MGEVLPNAIQLMAKAAGDAGLTVDGTVKSMMELQQKGGLISDKVLPHFAKRMSEAARANGGLDKALLSNRVAMNRLLFSFQEAADVMFKSGFATGLTELFNSIAQSVVDLRPLWSALGKIIGSVFSLISDGIKMVTPSLIAFSNVFESITNQIGAGREYLLAMIGPAAWLGRLLGGFAFRMNPWIAGITTALALFKELAFWAEELDNLLFSKNKIGVLYDPRKGANNNTSGNVAQYMLGAADTSKMGIGDSMMMSLMNMFSSGNIGSAVTSAMGSSINAGSFLNKQLTMTGTVVIDGQKVGEVAAKSDAVKDAIQSEIRGVQN